MLSSKGLGLSGPRRDNPSRTGQLGTDTVHSEYARARAEHARTHKHARSALLHWPHLRFWERHPGRCRGALSLIARALPSRLCALVPLLGPPPPVSAPARSASCRHQFSKVLLRADTLALCRSARSVSLHARARGAAPPAIHPPIHPCGCSLTLPRRARARRGCAPLRAGEAGLAGGATRPCTGARP